MWLDWTIDWTSKSSKGIRKWKIFARTGEAAAYCTQAHMPETPLSFHPLSLHKLSWQLFSQTYLLQRQHLTVFWTQLLRHWKNNHIQTSHLHLMKTLQEIRNNTSWKHSRLSAIQHMNQFRAAGETGCLPYFYTTKVVLILTVTQRMFSDIFRRKVNCAQNCLLTLQLLPDLGGRELQPRLQNKLQHHCHAQPILSYHLSKKARSYYSITWTTTKTSPSLLHEKNTTQKIY